MTARLKNRSLRSRLCNGLRFFIGFSGPRKPCVPLVAATSSIAFTQMQTLIDGPSRGERLSLLYLPLPFGEEP